MGKLTSPTAVEQVSGHLTTQTALTVISAIAAGPLVALLPVLAGSIAAERQKARIEKCLAEISFILQEHSDFIRSLSDEQYKLVNESVLALLQTTDQKKLDYLRSVVANSLTTSNLEFQEAAVLSRVIRDISAEEADYLIRTFQYQGIHLMAPAEGQEFTDNILRVDPSTRDALIVSGLMSLGLLIPAEPTYSAPSILRFSGIVAKLILLLRGPIA